MKHLCPVCGFPNLAEPPRTKNGGASFEICPSCGFQFGVSDDDEKISYAEWQAKWRKAGMKWNSVRPAPKGWDAARQLQGIQPKKGTKK